MIQIVSDKQYDWANWFVEVMNRLEETPSISRIVIAADAEIENAQFNAAVEALGENPTPAEIDKVYSLFVPADKWDGKTLTFTNVQQNGTEYVLYVDESNTLAVATTSADVVGETAQFKCKKEASGKYSFFNEKAQRYMIWRAGGNYGYNNNAGTLDTYNATYCDWSINSGSTSVEDTYYLVSKRADGSTDGSLVIMAASGAFDSFSNAIGYASNYSNLFRIGVVDIAAGVDKVEMRNEKSEIYDLTGRRVDVPAKGIYIIDGKKTFVK